MNSHISVIVPAYNEEGRIENVLNVLNSCAFLHEIIVVDDGSLDNTTAHALNFGNVTVLTHDRNYGKAGAVYTGVSYSSGDIFLFLDADLIGLTCKDVEMLLTPILEGQADMVVAKMRGTTNAFSGQRALTRSFLEGIDYYYAGYGLEKILNKVCRERNATIFICDLPHLNHYQKYQKWGVTDSLKHYFRFCTQSIPFISTGITGTVFYLINKRFYKK